MMSTFSNISSTDKWKFQVGGNFNKMNGQNETSKKLHERQLMEGEKMEKVGKNKRQRRYD